MTEENAVTTTDQTPAEYGDRQAVVTLSKRIKSMMPGGDKMTDTQAMALAQYSMLLDANAYRGEVYGYSDRHGFHLVDGYKMLVRWARRQCAYTETYEPVENLSQDAIGERCYILRDDARPTLREFVELGADFEQAYELATVSAIGVVTKSDMFTRDGKPISPPKGWTWDQVARKRALKNALNLSHGAPSPSEIAILRTQPPSGDDWTEIATPPPPTERDQAIPAQPTRGRSKLFKAEQTKEAHKMPQEPTGPDWNDLDAESIDTDVVDVATGEDVVTLVNEITGEIIDYAGGETDADAYEDAKQQVGRNVSEIVPTNWRELYEHAEAQYGIKENPHVVNIVRKTYPDFTKRGKEQPTVIEAWNAFVAYEQSKQDMPTEHWSQSDAWFDALNLRNLSPAEATNHLELERITDFEGTMDFAIDLLDEFL